MSPGKRRRVTFAEEPDIVTYEPVADQEALSQQREGGKCPAHICSACSTFLSLLAHAYPSHPKGSMSAKHWSKVLQ